MPEHLLVRDGGLFSTIQDAGRFGYQRFGISASGAMDIVSMAVANALVGNTPEMAVIEATLTGPTLAVEAGSCRIAVTGAGMPLSINGVAAAPYRSHDLATGDVVRIGTTRAGMRGYLAVAGGFALEPVLGSLSTHSRSGIGGLEGRALRVGDRLPLNGAALEGPPLELAAEDRRMPDGPIRVVLGPQDDAFTPAGIATFLGSAFTISAKADRMGYQLEGPAIEHRAGFNIVSDGIANGSVQVPGHGRPIILLADRQTTGGYPKIATVIGPDLPRLGQAQVGSEIRFASITAEEAEAIAAAFKAETGTMLAAIRPARLPLSTLTAQRLLSVNLISGVHLAAATHSPGDEG